MQSRRGSLTESAANMSIGFGMSWLTGAIAYPLLGIPVSPTQNTVIVVIFTVVSFIRSYSLRRIFNHFR